MSFINWIANIGYIEKEFYEFIGIANILNFMRIIWVLLIGSRILKKNFMSLLESRIFWIYIEKEFYEFIGIANINWSKRVGQKPVRLSIE